MTAGVIGATGYAGAELVRLLSGHPETGSLILSSVSFEGDRIENVYPNFLGKVSAALVNPGEVCSGADVVFAALPHGVGEPFAKACAGRGVPGIDLSADYRFDRDEETFRAWYGKSFVHPELRECSVYGLPELNRARIKELAAAGRVIVGNPGCYPTGASLGAFPAIARGLAAGPGGCSAPVIVDAASGITGGGREPSRSFHFPECFDSFSPYKVGSHRHTPEISRNFAVMAARAAVDSGAGASGASAVKGGGESAAWPGLIFTPHLAPMNRGILSTIYIPLVPAWRAGGAPESGFPVSAARPPSGEVEKKAGEIRALYADFYRDEPFVRVLPAGLAAATNRVRQSNYCDISVHLDQAGTTLIIASAIDNMVKGAAGQAVQNMNILMGFDEKAGLEAAPALF
jgi:N-acetyl-gamma-glutamyl-phosphate reductase